MVGLGEAGNRTALGSPFTPSGENGSRLDRNEGLPVTRGLKQEGVLQIRASDRSREGLGQLRKRKTKRVNY